MNPDPNGIGLVSANQDPRSKRMLWILVLFAIVGGIAAGAWFLSQDSPATFSATDGANGPPDSGQPSELGTYAVIDPPPDDSEIIWVTKMEGDFYSTHYDSMSLHTASQGGAEAMSEASESQEVVEVLVHGRPAYFSIGSIENREDWVIFFDDVTGRLYLLFLPDEMPAEEAVALAELVRMSTAQESAELERLYGELDNGTETTVAAEPGESPPTTASGLPITTTFDQTSMTLPFYPPCAEVSGPDGEIYRECLADDGSIKAPVPDPVTGEIPCDTRPPATLAPGCIGYQE